MSVAQTDDPDKAVDIHVAEEPELDSDTLVEASGLEPGDQTAEGRYTNESLP